jgi:hypothetical protein
MDSTPKRRSPCMGLSCSRFENVTFYIVTGDTIQQSKSSMSCTRVSEPTTPIRTGTYRRTFIPEPIFPAILASVSARIGEYLVGQWSDQDDTASREDVMGPTVILKSIEQDVLHLLKLTVLFLHDDSTSSVIYRGWLTEQWKQESPCLDSQSWVRLTAWEASHWIWLPDRWPAAIP